MADGRVEPVVSKVDLPAGMLGPDPVSFEVRSFVKAGPDGVVLVDTGTPGSGGSIGHAIASIGARWSDVTDIVLTHRHFDHVGGLREAADLAPRASVWAGAGDASEIVLEGDRAVRPVADRQQIGVFRVLATPGHTAGHVSLFDEEASVLLIGDLVGSDGGALTFGPPSFTSDSDVNIQSLRRMLELDPDRILFSHGEEVPNPGRAIAVLLEGPGPDQSSRSLGPGGLHAR